MGNVILQHRGKARQKLNKEAECSNESLGEKKLPCAVCMKRDMIVSVRVLSLNL